MMNMKERRKSSIHFGNFQRFHFLDRFRFWSRPDGISVSHLILTADPLLILAPAKFGHFASNFDSTAGHDFNLDKAKQIYYENNIKVILLGGPVVSSGLKHPTPTPASLPHPTSSVSRRR
ncbi:hypothetical protein EVAR_29464_1 [Eumeta japonica]|uniref:Uncharacterized protein n=1 Tax=Eumeta variegata TaxID=151549 RepID=A0A4C1WSN7_EUMVA|nr:hypothetical protein EVAR_29464_1 [Eumeta japonica]